MCRRTWLVVALAAAMLAAMAVPALAVTGGAGYRTWTAADTTAWGSPHGGYTTTTKKCVVCHAVHNAEADLGDELLLKSSVENACTYCHISGGTGYTTVYAGVEASYTTDAINGHNYDTGASEYVSCTNCHQVHAAASAMSSNASLTASLLTGAKYGVTGFYDTVAGGPAVGDNYQLALTKWCTKCHAATYSYYNGPDYQNDPSGATPGNVASTHIMTSDFSSYEMPDGSSKQVAWASSEYCSSCHSSGFGVVGQPANNWPHLTSGARFLVSGSYAGSADTTRALDTKVDGVCLRCHADGVNSGTGMDF